MDHRKVITVTIGNLYSKIENNLEIRATASNSELACYGPDVASSEWEVIVCPAEKIKRSGECRAVATMCVYLRLLGAPTVRVTNLLTVELLDGNGKVVLKKNDDKGSRMTFTAGPTTPKNVSYGWDFIQLTELFASPEKYCDNDCVVLRFTINFRIVAGGDFPDSPVHQLRQLGKAYTSKPSSDFTLISSDQKRFPVHREFLATCSANWARLLEGQPSNGAVQMPNVDATTLLRLLEDCYNRPHQPVTPQEAVRYLVASKQFRVDNCYERALAGIGEKMSIGEVVDMLKLATEHSLDRLKQQALDAIQKHAHQLTIDTALPVLELAAERNLDVLSAAVKKALEKVAVTVDTAAAALKIAAKFGIPLLMGKTLDVISDDMGGFVLAGGFSDIPSELSIVIGKYVKDGHSRKKQKT